MCCGWPPTGCTNRSRTRVTGAVRCRNCTSSACTPRSRWRRKRHRSSSRGSSARPGDRCGRVRVRARGGRRISRWRKGRAGFGRRPVARSSDASRSWPKRRAKPSRGKRRQSPPCARPWPPAFPAYARASARSSPAAAAPAARRDRPCCARTAGGRRAGRRAQTRAMPAARRDGHACGGTGVGDEFLLQARAQRARTAEQPQAAAHFEQHGVGRSRLTRGEKCRLRRARASSSCRSRRRSRASVCSAGTSASAPLIDMPACTRGLHGCIAGAHDLAIAVEVDDRDGRPPGQRLRDFAQRIEQQRGQVQREPEFARPDCASGARPGTESA